VEFTSYNTQGTLANVLTDTLNDIYILTATSSVADEKAIEINVDLGSLTTFNTVSFSYTSTREMPCELYLSEDGENYIPVYDMSNRDYAEWNFNLKTARFIRIVCHKTEPDGISAANTVSMYEYYFILKYISIAKEEFESKSVFVSKLIDFNDLTSTIKLDATDMIFSNTRIDYFIGFDNGVDKIGWDAIENHEDYHLSIFGKRHKILNYHVETFGQEDNLSSLYKLYKLPENINKNSIKLTPAYNMWSVKRYVSREEQTDFTLATGDFSTYAHNSDVTQLFMDCENYNKFRIYPKTLYVMTQFVSLEQSMNLFNKFIRVMDEEYQTDLQAEIKIFVNGYEITMTDNMEYSFALRRGVNKIQIAIYSMNEAVTQYLYHNLNFKALTNDVFGFVPMKYTSNAVLEKTIGETYQYYTIRDGYIYVKCNPSDMIQSDLNDMGYFMSYYTLNEDMIGYFENNHITFRIMAVLSSTDRNLSPELINFRITGR
jgi:hypothetical protein